jgi:hypothetical protein
VPGFEGEPVPAMRSLDEDRVIYLGSFSKTFAPGFRVGWVLAPHAVREKLVLAQESATLCPPAFSQYAVTAYLANYDWRGQIKVFREMYRERRNAMLAGLAEDMPAGTSWTVPGGGFFVWVTLPAGLDSRRLCAAGGNGAGRVRARHRLLRRRLRQPAHATVVLLPHPGADPGGHRRLGEVLQYEAGCWRPSAPPSPTTAARAATVRGPGSESGMTRTAQTSTTQPGTPQTKAKPGS